MPTKVIILPCNRRNWRINSPEDIHFLMKSSENEYFREMDERIIRSVNILLETANAKQNNHTSMQ